MGRGGQVGRGLRRGRVAVVGAVIYALWVFNMQQHLESLPQFLLWQLQRARCRCRCPMPHAACRRFPSCLSLSER